MSYFFFLCWWPSLSSCTVYDSISSNMDEVLLISPSANGFVFEDFNIHYKDWLTYSGGTDRSGELFYNFSISNDITQMVNFPTWVSLHWEILIIFSGVDTGCSRHWRTDCGAQMSTFSFWISPWMPHFIALLMTILVLIGTVFVIIREMFQGRMPLNLVLLQLLVNFVNGLRLKLMYISLIKSIRLSLTHLHGFQLLVLLQ